MTAQHSEIDAFERAVAIKYNFGFRRIYSCFNSIELQLWKVQ